MAKGPITEKRVLTGLRIPPSQKAEIKRRAEKARLTFTEYMIRCALGETIDMRSQQAQLDALERRIELVERKQRLGG